jgi:hypothetical protein
LFAASFAVVCPGAVGAEEASRFSFGGAISATVQSVNGARSGTGRSQTRLGYRGDLELGAVVPGLTGGEGGLQFQIRFGQGEGVAARTLYTGAVNSLAFSSADGGSGAVGVLLQAYYTSEVALGASGTALTLNVGKIDPFGFFDGNAIADDEAAGFLNNVFVHNPLLDSGGDVGVDDYGATPALVGEITGRAAGRGWRVALGVFGNAQASTFEASPRRPWWLVQAESSRLDGNGDPVGTWRLLAWSNRESEGLEGERQTHAGWGVSADERLTRTLTGFVRLGQRTQGEGRFDWAVTTGLEWQAAALGRPDDALGLAVGTLHTDDAWARATAADASLAGFAASGRETSVEVFYRLSLGEEFHVGPSVQWVRRPGGEPGAATARVFGLRATLGF